METEQEIREKDFPETFIHYVDKVGICVKCNGTKELVSSNGATNDHWRYFHTTHSCKHIWRKFELGSR